MTRMLTKNSNDEQEFEIENENSKMKNMKKRDENVLRTIFR